MTGTSVAAAILAGGRARRYGGVVKSTLVLDGARIIDRQIAELRKVADPIFIVAQDPAPFASLGLVVVPDVVPDCGALGGIYTAIVLSPRPRTLVVAGDLPFLSPALLARLVQETDADLVVPRGPQSGSLPCGPRGTTRSASVSCTNRARSAGLRNGRSPATTSVRGRGERTMAV